MKILGIFIFLLINSSVIFGQQIKTAHQMATGFTGYSSIKADGYLLNQASLGYIKNFTAIGSAVTRSIPSDVNEIGLMAALPLEKFVGAGIQVKSFGDDVFSEKSFGISLGRQLFKEFSLGIGLEYYNLSIAEYGNQSGFTGQVGFISPISKKFTIASHVYIPIGDEEDQTTSSELTLNAEASFVVNETVTLRLGAIKKKSDASGIQAGIIYSPLKKLDINLGILTFPFHMTGGVALGLSDKINIQAATAFQQDLGWNAGLGIIYINR